MNQIFTFLLICLLSLSLFGNSSVSEIDTSLYFNEVNGLVVAEFESLTPVGGWIEKADRTGFSGTSFFEWSGSDNFGSPGNGLMEYVIKINNPGKYRFQWRCKVGHGTNTTEANDTWLRLPNASKFYAIKSSTNHMVRPKGVCSNDCPNGAGSDGWFKVYSSGTTSWTWNSYTSDNDAHAIFAEFDSPGFYTIQISGRSKHHLIDRFVLYKSNVSSPTSLSKAETKVDNRKLKYRKLVVRVKEEGTNKGIAEANVYLNRSLKVCGLAGTAFFYNVDTSRNHILTVRKDGFEELEREVKIGSDTLVILELKKVSTSNLEQNDFQSDIIIAPNPFTQNLKVFSSNRIKEIVISDVTGKVVFHQNHVIEKEYFVDLAHLQNGIYFARIQISGNQAFVIRKIVKSGF